MLPPMVRLNGKMHTRNSCTLRFNGLDRITAIDTTDWSDEKPYELVPGVNLGGSPLGKAEGVYTCSANLALYSDEAAIWELLGLLPLAQIGAGAPTTDISKANFQLSLTIREDVRTRAILMVDCNVVGRSSGVSNDGKAITTAYKLQPRVVVVGGTALCNLLPALF